MTLFLSKFFAEKSLGSAVLAFGARYQLLEKSLRILDAQKRALHSLLLKRQLSFKNFCCGSSIFVAHFGCTHKQRPSASRRVGETVSRHEKTSQHCRGFGGTAFCSAAEPTNSLALIDFALLQCGTEHPQCRRKLLLASICGPLLDRVHSPLGAEAAQRAHTALPGYLLWRPQ